MAQPQPTAAGPSNTPVKNITLALLAFIPFTLLALTNTIQYFLSLNGDEPVDCSLATNHSSITSCSDKLTELILGDTDKQQAGYIILIILITCAKTAENYVVNANFFRHLAKHLIVPCTKYTCCTDDSIHLNSLSPREKCLTTCGEYSILIPLALGIVITNLALIIEYIVLLQSTQKNNPGQTSVIDTVTFTALSIALTTSTIVFTLTEIMSLQTLLSGRYLGQVLFNQKPKKIPQPSNKCLGVMQALCLTDRTEALPCGRIWLNKIYPLGTLALTTILNLTAAAFLLNPQSPDTASITLKSTDITVVGKFFKALGMAAFSTTHSLALWELGLSKLCLCIGRRQSLLLRTDDQASETFSSSSLAPARQSKCPCICRYTMISSMAFIIGLGASASTWMGLAKTAQSQTPTTFMTLTQIFSAFLLWSQHTYIAFFHLTALTDAKTTNTRSAAFDIEERESGGEGYGALRDHQLINAAL